MAKTPDLPELPELPDLGPAPVSPSAGTRTATPRRQQAEPEYEYEYEYEYEEDDADAEIDDGYPEPEPEEESMTEMDALEAAMNQNVTLPSERIERNRVRRARENSEGGILAEIGYRLLFKAIIAGLVGLVALISWLVGG